MYQIVATIIILAVTTAIATDKVTIPHYTNSPIATVLLVIAALGAFSVYPLAGLALFLLTAVLFFKRNVHTTISNSMYGETSIRTMANEPAQPYSTQSSEAREYSHFQETAGKMEGFEPAPYGDDSGSPVEGQYPVGEERPDGDAVGLDYTYRPDEDTGNNEFKRYGPDLDEKLASFKYTEY